MRFFIVTNNTDVQQQYKSRYEVRWVSGSVTDVLTAVRDQLHQGHVLLSHPLAGSIKPNESPYKSVLVSVASGTVDPDSLTILENAMQAVKKFGPIRRNWQERELADFRLIDQTLIDSAVASAEADPTDL